MKIVGKHTKPSMCSCQSWIHELWPLIYIPEMGPMGSQQTGMQNPQMHQATWSKCSWKLSKHQLEKQVVVILLKMAVTRNDESIHYNQA